MTIYLWQILVIVVSHPWQIIVAVASLLICWRITHMIHKTFADRCPHPNCGGLRMEVTYYMEVNPDAPYGIQMGKCYDTHKFLRCKKGKHLRHFPRTRYFSLWSLVCRRIFKPHHLKWGKKIADLFHEAGLDVPTPSVGLFKLLYTSDTSAPLKIPLPVPPQISSSGRMLPKVVSPPLWMMRLKSK